MQNLTATILVLAVILTNAFITGQDVQRCIDSGRSDAVCNHIFNR